MSSRRRSRERALQILFLWDAAGRESSRRQSAADAIKAYYDTLYAEEQPHRDAFVDDLVTGAVEHVAESDSHIARHAEHWRVERMPAVDRNILRLAAYEMIHAGTPAAIVIDEALELARKFSTEESVQFINAVLDAIHRESAATAPEPHP